MAAIADMIEQALTLGARILLAAVLGGIICYYRDMDRHRLSILQTHAFLAVAGAMLIMIIGDQIERAVGLIGVASVIRYRYAIRYPKDASTLIIALGLGMACGANLIGMALVGALFVLILSRLFDLMPRAMPPALLHPQRETQFRIVTTNPEKTLERLETILSVSAVGYNLNSLERKKRDLGPVQTVIEGTVRFNGDLQVSDLTAELADDDVLQVLWREIDPTE